MSQINWDELSKEEQKKLLLTQTFERINGVLTDEEQGKLLNATAIVVGAGGVGAIHAITLARQGFGRFILLDPDTYSRVNISRQFAAFESTIDLVKIRVLKEIILDINPCAEVLIFEEGLTRENADEVFNLGVKNGKEMCLLVDGIDLFEMPMRLFVFQKARFYGIYAITAAPLGFGTTLQIFDPKAGETGVFKKFPIIRNMTFEEYTGIKEDMDEFEMLAAFVTSLNPIPYHVKYMDVNKVMLSEHKGIAVPAGTVGAAYMLVSAAVNVIVRRKKVMAVPHFVNQDVGFGDFKSRKAFMFLGQYCLIKFIGYYVALRQIRNKYAQEMADKECKETLCEV